MSEIKKYSRMTDDLLVYGGDTSKTPTTMQQIQEFMKQEADSVGDLVDSLLWQPNSTYEKNSVVHSPNIPAGYVAECTNQGQSGNNEPLWDVNTKNYSDGTVTWQLKNALGGDGVPIGVIVADVGVGNIPAGYLLCDGSFVSKITYPALFEAIGYTFGGSGDNFNLPNLTERFLEGGATAGQYKEAGLPNIEGEWIAGIRTGNAMRINGAFEEIQSQNKTTSWSSSGSNYAYGFKFDASLSDTTYGNSETVQPKSLIVRFIIKAFDGTTSTTTEIDVTNLANELIQVNQKVNSCVKTVNGVSADTNGNVNVASGGGGSVIPNGICSTARGTNAKVVTVEGNFTLAIGQMIYVKFTNGNTATTPTLNVNGTGAKNVRRLSLNAYDEDYTWVNGLFNLADTYQLLIYDGNNWKVSDVVFATYISND